METATPFDFKNENNLICEALVKFQLPLIFALSQEIRKIIYTDAPMKENIQRKKKGSIQLINIDLLKTFILISFLLPNFFSWF